MPWVATRQDLYTRLPAAACVPDARQIAGYIGAPVLIDLPGHGFDGGETVSFAARTGATLDTAISPTGSYTVARDSSRFFHLAGVPLNGDGVGLPYLFEDVEPKIDRILADRTSYVIACAIAYRGPWTTPPLWAPGLVADLAAPIVARALRMAESRYPVEDVRNAAVAGEKIVALLLGGATLNDGTGPIDATPTLADDSMRAAGRHPRALGAQRGVTPWGQRGSL